ncbi:MAG: D-alanyl-D-alanine carboxypeptidase [candidate division WOR-3 bacterium]
MWIVSYISEIWLDNRSCEVHREYFSEEYVMPASTLKSLWAIVLLKELGENYRIPTIFAIKKDTLFIRFNGDPTLRFSTLDSVLKEKISTFDFQSVKVVISFPKWGERYGYGWAWEDIDKGYITPITPISINYGKVSEDSALRIYIGNVREETFTDSAIYIPRSDYRYRDPLKFVEHIVKRVAKDFGKKVKIVTLEGDMPDLSGFDMDTIYSPTLVDMLRPTLYYSINFMADMLVAHYSKGLSNAGDKFKEFMKKLGMDGDAYIFDGTGLSRYNLIRARDAAFIMCAGSKGLSEYALDIFPSPGEGTLKRRLVELGERVYAKTGTLFGVSALLGFYRGCNEEYVFGIFVQNYPITEKARAEIDNLVRTYGGILDCGRVEAK